MLIGRGTAVQRPGSRRRATVASGRVREEGEKQTRRGRRGPEGRDMAAFGFRHQEYAEGIQG